MVNGGGESGTGTSSGVGLLRHSPKGRGAGGSSIWSCKGGSTMRAGRLGGYARGAGSGEWGIGEFGVDMVVHHMMVEWG